MIRPLDKSIVPSERFIQETRDLLVRGDVVSLSSRRARKAAEREKQRNGRHAA